MDHSLRLPPIRSMDASHSRATSAQPTAWTAINHRPDVPGPVSPRAQPPKPQANDTLPPPPQPHRHLHHGEAQPDRSNLSLPPIVPIRNVVPSLGRSLGEHHASVEKPITPERQDSLIASSAPSQMATVTPPTTASFPRRLSPEIPHRNLLRDSVTHPLTPPSDSSSTATATAAAAATATSTNPGRVSAHSLACRSDRRQESPAMRAQQERSGHAVHAWERPRSDSARPTIATLPHSALFGNETGTMPPPPVPAPTSPSSQHAPRDVRDPPNAVEDRREEEGREDRCAYCLATWSYPLMDIASVSKQDEFKSQQESLDRMAALSEYVRNYTVRKNADYERWKHFHFGGHCHYPDPQAGSKRKLEGSSELGLPPSKSTKYSSESPPPRQTRLTPPPEQAPSSGSPSATSSATEFIYRTRQGRTLQLSRDTAVVVGLNGAAQPSRYEPSDNDPSNMWKVLKKEEGPHQ